MVPTHPVSLSFQNLTIWASPSKLLPWARPPPKKMILKGITGSFVSGTSTAILGPSGSGKTTLLNYLTDRMRNSKLHINGSLKVNNIAMPSIDEIKHRFAYVMQDDVLYESQTVYNHIYSAAMLSGVQNSKNATDLMIEQLGLQSCKNTRIGGEFFRGISGGEKKRTAIATEIIRNPSVVFLDEPTTGLDSKSALDVAAILKMMAQNGRTLISTIH